MIVVLAEPVTAQATLAQSPENVLTLLEVAPPEAVDTRGTLESPVIPILQIDERTEEAAESPSVSPETIITGDKQGESVEIETPLVQSTSRPQMNPVSDVIIGRDESGAQEAMVGIYSISPGAEFENI